jgi:hypothetical protein
MCLNLKALLSIEMFRKSVIFKNGFGVIFERIIFYKKAKILILYNYIFILPSD